MRDHHRQIIAFLARSGATDIRLVITRVHPRIEFTWDGLPRRYTVPGTPSDVRGVRNALADLPRIMGLTDHAKHIGERRERRGRARRPPVAIPAITALPDWREALSRWRR